MNQSTVIKDSDAILQLFVEGKREETAQALTKLQVDHGPTVLSYAIIVWCSAFSAHAIGDGDPNAWKMSVPADVKLLDITTGEYEPASGLGWEEAIGFIVDYQNNNYDSFYDRMQELANSPQEKIENAVAALLNATANAIRVLPKGYAVMANEFERSINNEM